MAVDQDLQQKFEACVDACAESMYRVAYRLTGNHSLARELVQETYLGAWKNIQSLRDVNRMRAWLFGIMRNQYTKLLTRETRAVETTEQTSQIPDHNNGSTHKIKDSVQDALSELEEKYRMPLLLVSIIGMSVQQASVALGIPPGTVLSRMHRGKTKLKEILIRTEGFVEGQTT
ncbi:MAG: RNA polymerase sigma factor [Planctomycetota bacterium]